MAADVGQDPMHTLAMRAQSSVDAERTTIYQIDRSANEIFSRVALGLDPSTVIRLPLSRGLIGFVARTGRTLRLRDAYNDPRFDQTTDRRTGYRTRSMLCVPISDPEGTVIGAIQAINKYNGVFTDSDERQLLALCPEAAHLLATQHLPFQDAGRAQQP